MPENIPVPSDSDSVVAKFGQACRGQGLLGIDARVITPCEGWTTLHSFRNHLKDQWGRLRRCHRGCGHRLVEVKGGEVWHDGNDETVQFWEHDLPLQMANLAAQLAPSHRFDAVVVDEAQDFADAWWDPLLAALERSAVVVVVNEAGKFERSRERLYVGLSRAREQLVVCGDQDFIREVGGPDLFRRLNIWL